MDNSRDDAASRCRAQGGNTSDETGSHLARQPKAEQPAWTTEPPTEQGEYWNWDGDDDHAPMIYHVLWSGTAKKCFVSIGQYGIENAIWCDEFGGHWMKIEQPSTVAKVAPAGAQNALFPERDLSKPAEQQGLFRKFDVRRVDGSDQSGGKHYGCRYYVLDLNHDQHAPAAMRAYAASCRATHPQLAADIEAEFGAQNAEAIRNQAYETAAKLCDAKFMARALTGHTREASAAARLAEEIRALQSGTASSKTGDA